MQKNIKTSNLKSEREGFSQNKKDRLSKSLRENLKKRKIQSKNRKKNNNVSW